MFSSTPRSRPATGPALPLLLTSCALAFAVAAFLLGAVAAADAPDDNRQSLPRCGAVSPRTGGDYVPAGPRPCVLNAPGRGRKAPETGSAPLAPPGTAAPSPASPKAPAAPPAAKPKTPAAPAPAAKVPAAPRPPSIVKRR
ncbi:hypothetical protein ACIQ9R_36105 [Streptomyces sp. NPDC094447]|uniref:hypothetical protein n=1 Tax=Streptomyces sp. NPDC094447 TaxID=3366062 RepID=UPI0037FD90A0